MSIMGSLAIMGGVTFALFDDSATAQSNTFATGNADLQISLDTGGVPDGFGSTVDGPDFTGVLPGQTRTYDFWLKNNSSDPIVLDLTADVNAITPADDPDQDIDNALLVRWVCDNDLNLDLSNDIPSSEFSPRDWLN